MMTNNNIELNDLMVLCEEFKVNFSVEVDNHQKLLFYKFGEIQWAKRFNEQLNWEDYIGIIKHLSAKYPERVLE